MKEPTSPIRRVRGGSRRSIEDVEGEEAQQREDIRRRDLQRYADDSDIIRRGKVAPFMEAVQRREDAPFASEARGRAAPSSGPFQDGNIVKGHAAPLILKTRGRERESPNDGATLSSCSVEDERLKKRFVTR